MKNLGSVQSLHANQFNINLRNSVTLASFFAILLITESVHFISIIQYFLSKLPMWETKKNNAFFPKYENMSTCFFSLLLSPSTNFAGKLSSFC